MLRCGNTRLYELLAAHELQSFRDGRSRKITVELIHRYIEQQLAARATDKDQQCRRRGRPRKAGV